MFFRKITTRKNGKEYVYVKLIENYRTNGRMKQRVVANFGSIDNLSPNRINELIISLKRLAKDLAQQEDNRLGICNIGDQVINIKRLLNNIKIISLLKSTLCQEDYQLLEALVLKIILIPEISNPIQEVCKDMGLVDATSIQFYNLLKELAGTKVRNLMARAGLTDNVKEETAGIQVYIHVIKSTFRGSAFDMDIGGGVYFTKNYSKPFILLLACDEDGNPVGFAYVDEIAAQEAEMDLLIQQLTSYIPGDIIILDRDNIFNEKYLKHPVAKQINGLSKEVAKLVQQGCVNHDGRVYFNTLELEQVSEGKIKEIKANLAKVTAGLENIKADILLGKINKESVVRKKAAAVIKGNNCQDFVTYQFNESDQAFNYQVNEDALKQKMNFKNITTWYVLEEKLKGRGLIKNVKIKTDRFKIITDQLNIPPVNMYAEYHYSSEIISGHISLKIIKKQIAMVAKLPQQGGETQK